VPHLKVSGKGDKVRHLPLHPGTISGKKREKSFCFFFFRKRRFFLLHTSSGC